MVMVVLGVADGASALEAVASQEAATAATNPGPLPQQGQGSAAGQGHDATSGATSAQAQGGRPGAMPAPGELPQDTTTATTAPVPAVIPPPAALPKTDAKTVDAPPRPAGAKVTDPAKSFDPVKSKELPKQRTENARTFQNADGTFTTRTYPQAVNFRRADGTWAAIDTTLIPTGTAGAGRAAPVQTGWTSTSGERELTLAQSANTDPLVRLQLADGISVGYTLDGAAPAQGTAHGSTITYPEARPHADVTFVAGSTSFKETLVLKDPAAPAEWLFPLRLQGVAASLEGDGAVVFKDAAGAVRGRMPAGWMMDSAFAPNTEEGAFSGGVRYELVANAGGQALKVTLDQAWLAAPERVYPVKVDPSFSSVKAVDGTYVQSPYNQDFSADTVLKVGTYDGGGHQAASFVRFNGIENDLRNAAVLNVSLGLHNSWSYSCTPSQVSIHPVTSAWSEGSLRTMPGPDTGPALAAPSFAHGWRASASAPWGCEPGWESIYLGDGGRSLVNAWTHGWAPNYGLAIKADPRDSRGWKQFGSDDMPGGQPSLDVTWSKYGADYENWGLVQPVTATQDGIVRLRVWNRGMETWTPTNSYKMSYMLYDQWGNHITDYGTNIAWTAMPYDVPPGGAAVVDAHIRALPQGAYTVAFTMDDYQTSNFYMDAGVPRLAIQISSINMPPHLTRLAPPSNAVVYQVQPTLTAEGQDPDSAPNPGLDYKFSVCRVIGDNPRVDCRESGWLARQSRFGVPAGWLSWNEQYAWYAKTGDGAAESDWSQPSLLRTILPQPSQYTTGADAGRSVSTATGNYTTAATDASLPTVGPELSLTRSYNSLDPRTTGLFGAGWTTPWDMRIQAESGGWLASSGNVLLTASNGSRARFGWDPGKNAYVAGSGIAADLRKLDDGNWMLVERGGTVRYFDPAGRLGQVVDMAGHVQELFYTDGRLTQVKDTTSGRALSFAWTGDHVTAVTASGVTGGWSYQYDGDRLAKVCPPGVPTTAAQGCTVYEYGTGSRYRTGVRDSGPSGYWRLGESTGTSVANDAKVGDRAPGGAQDIAWGAPGALGSGGDTAVTFNGRSTSWIELPNRAVSASVNRSVELWFRTDSAGVILSLQNRAMGEDPYNVVPALYVGSDGRLRGFFYGVQGGPVTTAGPVNDSAWHHVVLAGARDTTALFLDGALVGTAAGDIDHLNMDRAYLGGGYTGTMPGGNGGSSWFSGQIDDVAVYDYPLTEQTVAEHYALRGAGAQLTKTVLPTGRTSAQVTYDAVTERAAKITDAGGGEWKLSEPTFTGGSFLYNNAVKTSEPAGFWRLGERDGALAASDTGTGLTGTYGDGVAKNAPGVFAPTDDTAARFDGSAGSSVEIPQDVLHAKTDLAVELWFTTDRPGVLLGDQSRAIDDSAGPGGTWTPILYVGDDGKLRGRFHGSTTSTPSENAVNDSAWHHVVLSAQGSNQTLYLDGKAVGTQSGTVDHQQNTHTYLGAGFAAMWPASPGDVSHFTGSMDEVAVYQHPLSEADVLAHYRARSAQVAGQGVGYRGSVVTDAPAGFWHLDETSGTTAASEVAATKGNGSYAPAVRPGLTGVFGPGDGHAAEFHATSASYVDLPAPLLQAKSDLAAELWFRTGSAGVILSEQSEPMGAAPYNTVPVLYVGSDGRLRGLFYGIDGDPITSGGAVNDGSWHHAVISAAQGTQSLYLDGALVGTATGTVDHLNMNRTYLGGGWTGSMPGGNGGWSWFDGYIDEVAFYQHPLSADRVAAHYQARSASSSAELASRVTLTDPAGNVSTDIHDATRADRLIARTDAGGGTTSYTYDTGGFVHTVTDPNGHTTVSGQDERGNTLSLTTCRDADSCWTSYTSYFHNQDNPRDPRNDKPTETRDARSAGPTDDTYRTTVSYNALGLPETTTRPDGRATHASYTTGTEPAVGGGTTPPGLLATETTAGGAVTTYTYRASGDLAATTTPSGLKLTYEYDNAGRKTSATETSDAQPAGVTTTYAYDDLGHLTAQTGPKVTDAVTGTEHQTKTTVAFDQDGRITGSTTADIVGTDGSRTASTLYDAAGRAETDTDAEGAVTRYGYDNLGRTTSVTDPLGQVTRATYTPRGQLATTIVNGWNGDGNGTRDLTVESRAYDPAGRLASVTDAMGAVTSYTYFDDGLPATTTARNVTQADGTTRPIVLEADEYDGAGQLTKRTTGGGRTTTVNTVDTTGRITQSVLDPAGLKRTTTTGYDADDRVTSTTLKVSDTENSVQTNTYDPAGRLTRTQLASSTGGPTAVSTFAYDQRGLLTASTSPNGNAPGADPATHTTTHQYDALGRAIATTAPQILTESGGAAATPARPTVTTGYNAFGEAVTTKDPLGRITRTTVDKLGRTTSATLPGYTPPGTTTPLTATSRVEYDKLSRVTASTDAAGRRTTYTYDRLGHQVQRVEPNSLGGLQPPVDDNPPTWTATWTPTGLPLSATDPVGARTEATYDQLGRTLTATTVERKPTPQNLTTTFTWDDAGNQTALTTPTGATSTTTYNPAGQTVTTTDPLGRVSTLEYDTAGRPVRAIAPLGESTRTHYDPLGNPTTTDNLDPTGTVLRTTTTAFDLEGRAVSSTSPATGAVTSTTYDALGRPTTLTEPVATGQNITTTFGYDAAGNRTRLTDGKGNTTVYTFNPWGLPESTIEPATTAHPAAADRTWTTAYDVAAQAVKLTEPGGVVRTSSYDPAGRLVRESGTGAEAATTDRELAYDKAGHLVRHNSSTLTGQSYAYNDRGLLIKAGTDLNTATQTWDYDADGRLTKRWDKDTGDTLMGYRADGQLDWAHNPRTGTQNRYGYDGDGRLAKQSYVAPDPADTTKLKTMSERRLGYDPLGRLTGDQLLVGGDTATPLTGTTYEYDLDNRLTRKSVAGTATDPVRDNHYGYDLAGRLTSWTADTTTTAYTWDAAGNRTGNGTATATYDERNRLLSDGTSTYRYTPRGTLAAVTTGLTQETLADDAFGRQVTEGTTTYTYDGLDRVTTRNAAKFTYDGGSNNLTGDGTWSYARDGAGTLLGATNGTANLRIRTDQHTDATATLNTDGTTVTGATTYDPFGKPVATTGTRSSLGYQSGWTDPDSGDVNMAARWYRPGTGGFTSRDSWQLDPSPSSQANRYTYANADPLGGTDPTGHENVSHCGCGGPGSPGAAGSSIQISAGNAGGGISFGKNGTFNGTIKIKPGANSAPAAKAAPQAEPYVPNTSGYRPPSSGANTAPMPGFSIPGAGVGGLGVSSFGSPSTAPSGYASSDVYQEKQAARDWRNSRPSTPTSAPQSPTGLPAANPTGPQQTPTCTACGHSKTPPRPAAPRAEPPKPLFDKTKPYTERPTPQADWTAPNPHDTPNIIAAAYSSADLLALLVLVPNALPGTTTAPGPQPGQSTQPDRDKPQSCLDRRPAGSDTDNKDGTGTGWIKYGNMEDVAGSPGVRRPTAAEACLTGTPRSKRGTGADGEITGWSAAKEIVDDADWSPDGVPGLARCHFIAREFGGRGVAQNLAPCFQVGVNTTKSAMRGFEVGVVGAAMRGKQIVDYTVTPVYQTPSSRIPMGFFMVAIGQYADGRPGVRDFRYVRNEKVGANGTVRLGD
ncbi:LamG-like jellyroll fold domain-containing protein [Kitasatospora sp. NPDC005751]|uniref:LamG-like jellyroll fold domain-containing protein n=1 Tax=Kitasatospora sp. NPDC005751 TaxID=3157064 RepID=UPI0033C39C76